MIMGIQIVAILFALVMAYLSYTHFKRRELNGREITMWMVFWAGFIFITVFPHSLDFLVRTFQLSRAMDLGMIIGFFLLTALTFRNFVVAERIERRMEDLVRSEAVNQLHGQQPSNNNPDTQGQKN